MPKPDPVKVRLSQTEEKKPFEVAEDELRKILKGEK